MTQIEPNAPHGAHHGAPHGAAAAAPVAVHTPVAPSAPCPPPKAGGHGGVARPPMRAPGHPDTAGNGAPHGALNGAHHGATQGATRAATQGAAYTAELLTARLEEAGETLLCLPPGGHSTQLRTSTWRVLHSAAESYGTAETSGRLRPPVPSAVRITRMDEALAWLALIPDDKFVLRRIVASRMLVSPHTGRHLHPWRRLATLLGADHKAIQRWHAQGIDMLVSAVNRT